MSAAVPDVVHCFRCGGEITLGEGHKKAIEDGEVTLAQVVVAAAHEVCPGDEPPALRRFQVEVTVHEARDVPDSDGVFVEEMDLVGRFVVRHQAENAAQAATDVSEVLGQKWNELIDTMRRFDG